jgi:general nucleoside transport system permease protein
MNFEVLVPILASTILAGTPILYATLGEILTERSGVLNLGVEGMMMVGALAAFLTATFTGNPVLGFLAGGLFGALLAGVHGLVCIGFQGNQVVSGLALTILGTGLANYFGAPYDGQTIVGFKAYAVPVLSGIPLLGPVLFNHDPLVYLSYFIPPLLWIFLKFTSWGLALRAVGEYPDAALAAGLPIIGLRWVGVMAGGMLVGFGGAYLSLSYTHLWTNGLSAGRGWIAVALVIFAFWRPWRAMLGAYLFGGVVAFQFRLQATGTHLPSSILMMLPYVLTIAVLVFSSWKGRSIGAPASLGVNIEPSE